MFLIDWVQNHIAQMILTGIIGIVVSRIALHGYRAKAALRIILATVQQFETEEKNLNAKGKGFLKPEHEKYLGMFVKALKNNVYRSSPISVDKTIAKEKKRLMNKGYITKGGNSTMKSILFIIALCLSLVVPCMADQVPVVNDINAMTLANEFSIEFNSGYMIDMSRADERKTLTAVHTISLIEYDLYEKSGINLDAGYRDKNGFVLGLSFDLQLARYFKKINMPIIRNIDPQFGYLGGWNMNQAEEDKTLFHGFYCTVLKGKF